MKKTLLLSAFCFVVFVACEREQAIEQPETRKELSDEITKADPEVIKSLVGTTWTYRGRHKLDGEWIDDEFKLMFTDTEANFVYTSSFSHAPRKDFAGQYTFDPPHVEITDNRRFMSEDGLPFDVIHRGTVTGENMDLAIHENNDLVMLIVLKKQ